MWISSVVMLTSLMSPNEGAGMMIVRQNRAEDSSILQIYSLSTILLSWALSTAHPLISGVSFRWLSNSQQAAGEDSGVTTALAIWGALLNLRRMWGVLIMRICSYIYVLYIHFTELTLLWDAPHSSFIHYFTGRDCNSFHEAVIIIWNAPL